MSKPKKNVCGKILPRRVARTGPLFSMMERIVMSTMVNPLSRSNGSVDLCDCMCELTSLSLSSNTELHTHSLSLALSAPGLEKLSCMDDGWDILDAHVVEEEISLKVV
jgi:hypothetical protein